jgi:hypothetical protein
VVSSVIGCRSKTHDIDSLYLKTTHSSDSGARQGQKFKGTVRTVFLFQPRTDASSSEVSTLSRFTNSVLQVKSVRLP